MIEVLGKVIGARLEKLEKPCEVLAKCSLFVGFIWFPNVISLHFLIRQLILR